MRTIRNLGKKNEKMREIIEKDENERAFKWIYVYFTEVLCHKDM